MKKYDFDTVYSRAGTNALKYEQYAFCDPKNVLPMWVADMDFRSPPAVIDALQNAANHGIFGYTVTGKRYDDAVISWYKKRMDRTICPEWISKTPGVMFAVAAAINALTIPSESVLICQPVYYPFEKIVLENGRRLVVSELLFDGKRYEMDFADMEKKIAENNVKLFLLCSPHNPVGRVWTQNELRRIGEICLEHGVKIVSDEIHSDFILSGAHTPLASLSNEIADITITCTSPSKTFNLAGLQAANIIISNEDIRGKFNAACHATGYGNLNLMAISAVTAAYENGEEWLNELLEYLKGNYDVLRENFTSNSKITLIEPEGTYLAWLDCRKMNLTDDELGDFFVNKAAVRLHVGSTFGLGGSGFVRMNIACPRSVLTQAVERITAKLD